VFSEVPAYAGKKSGLDRQFSRQIPKEERPLQALNRLTFGPQPGDLEHLRKVGVKKWIDAQLHPDSIVEDPILEQKLRTLDSLWMPSGELVRNYPAPQLVRQMIAGRVPFPADPDRRLLLQRVVARLERGQGQGDPAAPPEREIAQILTAAELRALRTGSPPDRLAAFQALPRDEQDEVIAALPPGIRQALYPVAPPGLRRRLEMAAGPAAVVSNDLTEGKLLRAIYSNRQLEEVLTDFWFNHFNIYLDKGADHYLVTEYEREAIRPHVLGKFRDLLEATAKSPAMLFYLDNWQSVGAGTPAARGAFNRARNGLNENYGRELLELHTLGVDGGYTQKDVTEVARCFTGWTINQPEMGGKFTFNPRMHDSGEKLVLGETIPAGGGEADGEKVLDLVARHPSTARFISRELARRFVADDPPAALVDRMALTFQRTDGNLREVMKTMLASKEFWSEGAYRSKVKSPFEWVASAVRATNGDVDYALPLANQVAQLGQPLYRKVEPTGYSNVSREWLNSAGLVGRMNLALQLANNHVPGVTVKSGAAEGIELGGPDFQKY
jgi:uncharacterized protein (DUF1800 family)